MRIETTRVAAPELLDHAAAFYASAEHRLDQMIPIVSAALERGEPVALAVRSSTERALRAALGSAAGVVTLSRPVGPDGVCGQTVAARRARELRELGDGGSITAVVEHDTAYDGADGAFWTELDAAANVALAELPVALTCFFPEMPLHMEVVDGARCNHRLLLVDGARRSNPDYCAPREVLSRTPAPPPPILGPPDVALGYDAWQLAEIRVAVEQAAHRARLGVERAEDVVLAVNEVATNAVEHGTTHARLLLWDGATGLVCEVHDSGRLADPLPGLTAPHPSDPRGRGVWIARQLCDVLHVWSDGSGTHVRMCAHS